MIDSTRKTPGWVWQRPWLQEATGHPAQKQPAAARRRRHPGSASSVMNGHLKGGRVRRRQERNDAWENSLGRFSGGNARDALRLVGRCDYEQPRTRMRARGERGSVQERFGGPRAGSGAFVAAAIRAEGIDCTALANGDSVGTVSSAMRGGAPAAAQSGQSIPTRPCSCAPSSPCTITFTAPALEHTSSIDCG